MRDTSADRAAFRKAVVEALPSRPDARAVWRGLAGAGVLAELAGGGADVDPELLDELLAELDAHLPLGVVLSVCVQVATALPLLAELARDGGPAAEVYGRAVRGDAVVALAVTDADAPGSALRDAGTSVRPGPDGFVLNGGKDWITNAVCCDDAIVLARHRPARHFTSFRWVLVPAGATGVSRHAAAGTLFAGSGVGHLRFRDVALGPEHLVGSGGRGLAQFARRIGLERFAGACWARHLCRRVLDDTLRFLLARRGGQASLWDNAAIRERFARCLVELRRMDALCAAYRRGDNPGDAANMLLKAACAEGVERILGECVQLRGADAFRDGGVAMLRAEAGMFGVAGGAAGAMLAGIAERAEELLEARG